MENRIEVLETSDISNEEIDRLIESFEPEGPASYSTLDDLLELQRATQERSAEIIGVPVQAFEYSSKEEEPVPQPVEPIIPTNSPTLLVEESSSRFSSAVWYDAVRAKSIVLAGVGGIGSYVAFLLSRMKPASLTIYDPDIVERANMSGQLYSKQDIGRFKADSITAMMANYSDFYNVFCIPERFTDTSSTDNIMICGFDNMEARKLFFNSWLRRVSNLSEEGKKKCLFIDGRLAAEEFQVFCITGDDSYHQGVYMKEYLFSDAEADETICSYKQTSHCANMIGSFMVNLFVNFVANECDPLIPRDLPFIVTYDAERMFFKTSI